MAATSYGENMSRIWWTKADGLGLVVLLCFWILTVGLVGIGGDYPLNDDWAYAWSARNLAHNGEMKILEWAAPSLVSHAAWGALMIRLFGDSFVVLRIGTLCFALVAILLLYCLSRQGGLDVTQAVFCALTLGASPWFSSVAFTYMTEVPWLALILAAFVCAISARQGETSRLFLGGVVVGVAALSRQFAIVIVPAFLLLFFRDARQASGSSRIFIRDFLRRAIAFCTPVVVIFGIFQYWYSFVHLPTAANSYLFERIGKYPVSFYFFNFFAIWHYFGLWMCPLVVATVLFWLSRKRRDGQENSLLQPTDFRRPIFFVFLVLLNGFSIIAAAFVGSDMLRAPRHTIMPYFSNLVWLFGIGPPTLTETYCGIDPPPNFHPQWGLLLTVLSTLAGAFIGVCFCRLSRLALHDLADKGADKTHFDLKQNDSVRVRLLLLGFIVFYFGWQLATSDVWFDRYLIPVLPAITYLTVAALPTRTAKMPAAFIGTAIFWLFTIIGTREYLSWNEARHIAVEHLNSQGVSPNDIDGGFEINGPKCWIPPRARQCALNFSWWIEGARYRLSFRPTLKTTDGAKCSAIQKYPYWSWKKDRAIWVMDCENKAGIPTN